MTSHTREFTGRHLLAIMLGFFTVIIAVNLTMAWFAGASWTGFVVRNSYVASQEFNGKVAAARAQKALGWSAVLNIEGGTASLSLTGANGQAIDLDAVILDFKNPAAAAADRAFPLADYGNRFEGPLDLSDGLWVVAIQARTASGVDWIETRRIRLSEGAIE